MALLADDLSIATDFACAGCAEELVYMDEVYLIRVVELSQGQNGLELCTLRGEEGDFLFEPYYFDIGCWEDLVQELHDAIEDHPPRISVHDAVFCHECKSGIQIGERVGISTMGEIRRSPRCPGGIASAEFHEISGHTLICLPCLSLLNAHTLEMWDDLSQSGECYDCLQTYCWRDAPCGCQCHGTEPQ